MGNMDHLRTALVAPITSGCIDGPDAPDALGELREQLAAAVAGARQRCKIDEIRVHRVVRWRPTNMDYNSTRWP